MDGLGVPKAQVPLSSPLTNCALICDSAAMPAEDWRLQIIAGGLERAECA
jgi:hypothetical protein